MGKMIIKIPADFKFVPGVRICIACIGTYFGFDEREIYQIKTIVDELCNNAVEHGSKTEEDVVTLEFVFSEKQLTLRINDTGNKKFNIEEVFAINKRKMEQGWETEEFHERGRGLIIVQKLVDDLDVEVTDEGTTITAIKKHREEAREVENKCI